MMEGMTQQGQEEYIWAMRTSLYRETSDSELWKERRATVTNVTKRTKTDVQSAKDDRQTKVMASLVPDEVITNVDDYSHRHYDACFLFGDVSGFTELCEKYNKQGVSGPSRMTQVLNKYLGSMVQEVLSHNGDVLKFSGDAFLAMFKKTENETMRDAVHEALDSALVIQKNHGSFLTDVGVAIRVKLAISTGLVTFALIGTPDISHYVVVGKPIWDVKAAEHISSAGDIVVAPAAWHYVNTNEYQFVEMPDGIHIKLLGVGPSWRSTQKNVRQQKDPGEESLSSDSGDSDDDLRAEGVNEEISLRPAVNLASRLRIKEKLRRFIIAPVMKSIDMDEPFEYLTEMRQAVIVFINVVSYRLKTEETVVLADQTYKIVCRVVEKMKGCVNKVSLFDKDLMFVCIFGLRGLKHELECQVALRCAKECHDEINTLPGVLSTSIGVTTGKTYCGVFGHTLRREYTVISLIVNKAARLMVAYKDKVTCDRETFLHSKLEARNFVLQEFKPLKGISHPGPVYEFREIERETQQERTVSARPFLGRHEHLEQYRQFISKTGDRKCKMMVVKGAARQGKTRLLDECIQITPTGIPVHKISLRIKDTKIPFETIRLIFSNPLKMHPESTPREKEAALLQKMSEGNVPELFCSLNDVFGVSFTNTPTYLSLTPEQRRMALRQMIKQLCYRCFLSLWVLAIDNCEFIDASSWELMDTFLDVETLFILTTLSSEQLNFNVHSKPIMQDKRVKTFNLTPIRRWYLGALVCQILDVYAISPELEKIIQNRSNGNPGWIESFLISLIQDDGLWIVEASLRDINDLGLVCPPLYMMARLTNAEKDRWQNIMEEKREPDVTMTCEDNWQKYIDSCRDSYLNIMIRERMENIAKGDKVRVCVVSPKFHVADDESELSMDVMIMRTFDSLNFYEQLLVKCSAILGVQFCRELMLYVMGATDKRKAAQAVQKLFEIRVLTCAKGDFLEGGRVVLKDRLLDPNEEEELKCRCRGVKIEDCCRDLPKYASCGYMMFRSSLFRDITYNLLTDKQKKEFHYRAIRYLERETRKCSPCGNSFFEQILGVKHDKDFLVLRDKNQKGTAMGALSSMASFDTIGTRRVSEHSVGTNYSAGSTKKKAFDEKSIMSFPSQILGDPKRKHKFATIFGFRLIKKLKNSYSLTRAFSSEDFADCFCILILSQTYAQLIDHATGAGDLDKMIEAMLEYAYVSILLSNIPLALEVLDRILEELKKKVDRPENWWKVSMIRGKVYTLIGFARLEMGDLDVAFKSLHKALGQYKVVFPRGVCAKMFSCKNECKQFFGFYLSSGILLQHLDHWETVYYNNLAECLCHLCNLYIIKEDWKNAEVAASWALVKALGSFSDFQIMCTAAANMLTVAQHYKKRKLCVALEVHALRLCHLKKNSLNAEDLKSVASLYGVIFQSRLIYSSVDKAIHMGYIVLRLCASIRAVKIILPLLPLLLHALLIGRHFSNVHTMLQELEYFYSEDSDHSGKVWYLAICVGIQLETGYSVVGYRYCENIYQMEGKSWVTIRDPDARRRFYTLMWLWCVRNERWEDAMIWCMKTTDFGIISESDSLGNKITGLYMLEGLLLYLVIKLDKRNVQAVIRAEGEIASLIKSLEKVGETAKIIMPRLLHLKAYYKYIKSPRGGYVKYLSKAKKLAESQGNLLELAWAEHSSKAWSRSLPAISIELWKEHSAEDNLLDFQEIEQNEGKLGFFTLPAPLYVW